MDISNTTLVSNLRLERHLAAQSVPEPESNVVPPSSKPQGPLEAALEGARSALERLRHGAAAGGDSRMYLHKVVEQRLKTLEPLAGGVIEGRDDVVAWQQSMLDELIEELPGQIHARGEDSVRNTPEFFDQLIGLINLIGSDYLDIYQGIVEKYSAFFDAFNSLITSKLQQWMESVNEGKDIELDVSELKKALEALMADLDDELFKGSQEDAAKWREALGLPESSLRDNGDGTWSVLIDRSPLTQMLADLQAFGPDDKVKLDNARFQAWKTGFDAQAERLKNKLQEYTQKYSSANSTYDNFIKVLSNHINQFADMLKGMVHNT